MIGICNDELHNPCPSSNHNLAIKELRVIVLYYEMPAISYSIGKVNG